jgi:hypothetical protein
MGEYQESLFFFEKLIEIKPDLPYGYGEIINAKTKICHWTFLDQNINDCLR